MINQYWKKRNNKIKNNFIWILFGNIFFALSQWLIISTISKFGNIEMVGEYTLALAITSPFFLLMNFNLRSMQATDQENELDFIHYFVFRNITSIIALFLVLVFLLFLDYSTATTIVIFIIGLIKIIESQSDIVFGYFQKIENMKFISISKIIKGIINVLTTYLVLLITNSLLVALFFMLFANIILLLFFDIKNLYKSGVNTIKVREFFLLKNNKKIFTTIIIMGIPLGISSMLDSLTVNSQRYIIESTLSISEVGYYSSIVYLMVFGQTIVGALAHAILPRLARYFINDLKEYVKFTIFLSIGGILLGGLLVTFTFFFGNTILVLLYTDEFESYSDIFLIVMIVASIWYLVGFLNTALLATRSFNFQFPVYFLSFLVTFILTFVLSNSYGLIGAAYALLGGMITRLLIILIVLVLIIVRKKKLNNCGHFIEEQSLN